MAAKQHPVQLVDRSRPPIEVIVQLAWPAILEQIFITMVQYVDTAMVGSLGAAATASVAVCSSTTWLLTGLMSAVSIGFSVQVSRNIGSGDLDTAKKVVRQSMLAVFCIGLTMAVSMQFVGRRLPYWMGADPEIIPDAQSYLCIITSVYLLHMASVVFGGIVRGAGDTRTPMLCNLVTNLLNVAGNFLLIFPEREMEVLGQRVTVWGAGWGVRGAAVSTALSTSLTGLFMLAYLFGKPSPIRISIRGNYRPDGPILKNALVLGIPTALERATISCGQIVSTSMVTGLGTIPLAANHLAVSAESISYMPASGFSTAATTLVAQSLGAKEKELAYQYGKLCNRAAVLMMVGAGALLFLFSSQLMGIFTSDPQVIAQGASVLKIVSFAEPFFAVSIVLSGVLRGAGDTKWPFYISVIGMWAIRLTSAWLLSYPLGLGLNGVWIGMAIDLIVRGVLCYLRFRNRGWLHLWDRN